MQWLRQRSRGADRGTGKVTQTAVKRQREHMSVKQHKKKRTLEACARREGQWKVSLSWLKKLNKSVRVLMYTFCACVPCLLYVYFY